jgi:hypothetical protein
MSRPRGMRLRELASHHFNASSMHALRKSGCRRLVHDRRMQRLVANGAHDLRGDEAAVRL